MLVWDATDGSCFVITSINPEDSPRFGLPVPAALGADLPKYLRTCVRKPLHSRILGYPTPQLFGYVKIRVPTYPRGTYTARRYDRHGRKLQGRGGEDQHRCASRRLPQRPRPYGVGRRRPKPKRDQLG